MNPEILAILFDIVLTSAPIVSDTMNADIRPAYDLFSVRSNPRLARAMPYLVDAGLAHPETWAGVTFYRLDTDARKALGA